VKIRYFKVQTGFMW